MLHSTFNAIEHMTTICIARARNELRGRREYALVFVGPNA